MTVASIEASPGAEELVRASSLDDVNPFLTEAYARARQSLGDQPLLVRWVSPTRGERSSLAFLRGGFLRRELELPSIDVREDDADIVWGGVLDFCRRHGVTSLHAESFGSSAAILPRGLHPSHHRDRWEFVLDLDTEGWERGLSSNHKRNLARARRSELRLRRTTDVSACATHARLQALSTARRNDRGEAFRSVENSTECDAYVRHGAGELFQALRDDEILSSMLVLRARSGAYYQSAGTSPAGMEVGASIFLVLSTAEALALDGTRRFNLGGAEPTNPGLHRFKTGFGARRIPLEAASYETASALRRKTLSALRLVRHPRRLARAFVGVERYVAYSVEPSRLGEPVPTPGLELRQIDDAMLTSSSTRTPELQDVADRRKRLGFNAAFGVYSGDTLAHVAWLIDSELDLRNSIRNVRIRPGEAEITHCLTAPTFRGRGIYPFAIRSLCAHAAARGIRRVFMITNVANVASQHGIERGGLERCGTIVRVTLPWLGNRTLLTFRGHRLRSFAATAVPPNAAERQHGSAGSSASR